MIVNRRLEFAKWPKVNQGEIGVFSQVSQNNVNFKDILAMKIARQISYINSLNISIVILSDKRSEFSNSDSF